MASISKQHVKIWVDQEISKSDFGDMRLSKRFSIIMNSLSSQIGGSIPFACQDWANTKAAYRFLANKSVDEGKILNGHFISTKSRFAKTKGYALILHDTTEFSYRRAKKESVGITHKITGQKKPDGRLSEYTTCGLLMHSSLVITEDGLPLGLAAIKFWTRKKFKGSNALKKTVNPTRVDIKQKESYRWIECLSESTELLSEPQRCVHIGDRESDIYELFCQSDVLGTHFLIRSCVDRLAQDGKVTIQKVMDTVLVKGFHLLKITNKQGKSEKIKLEIKYQKMTIRPPIGKQKNYSDQKVTVIHAVEKNPPKDREAINWKLITTLPVSSKDDAIRLLGWYALRWKIEVYHKILKSGCKAESAKLRSAEKLVKLISIYCIVGWRIFWISMINRTNPDSHPAMVLTKLELDLINRLTDGICHSSVSSYIIKIAQIGGYLNRKLDAPPGNHVIWRGLTRLTDIMLGYELATKRCG